MKKLTVQRLFVLGIAILSAIGLWSAPARANVVSLQLDFEGQGNSTLESWNFNPTTQIVYMDQQTDQLGPSKTRLDASMWGTSTLRIRKTVTNKTTAPWTGYQFDVSGYNVQVLENSWSDTFELADVDDGTVTFQTDLPLAVGETARFDLRLTLYNPEPSTVVLLAAGAVAAIRRRRKHSR